MKYGYIHLINQGTKPQRAVMNTLFSLGTIAVILTLIMTVHYLLAPEYYTDTNISETFVFSALIDLIFWLSFYILYKKWKLKWDWINFLPGPYADEPF